MVVWKKRAQEFPVRTVLSDVVCVCGISVNHTVAADDYNTCPGTLGK